MIQDVVIQKLDRAKQALAEANTIQQTKQILDVATAAEIYAKRQQLGEDAINYAFEIKIEALARLGDLLKETPKATGGEHGGKTKIDGSRKEPSNPTPTLADLGLDKKTSMIAQQTGRRLPEDVRHAIATKSNHLDRGPATGTTGSPPAGAPMRVPNLRACASRSAQAPARYCQPVCGPGQPAHGSLFPALSASCPSTGQPREPCQQPQR